MNRALELAVTAALGILQFKKRLASSCFSRFASRLTLRNFDVVERLQRLPEALDPTE